MFMTRGYQHENTSVHLMMYHFIWIPKRRKKILVGKIKDRLIELINSKAKELECKICSVFKLCGGTVQQHLYIYSYSLILKVIHLRGKKWKQNN